MKRTILALPLLLAAALPTTARADPKDITLDGCAKVQKEVRKDHDRTTITVKCTGESFDPEVRKPIGSSSLSTIVTPSSQWSCYNGKGEAQPCRQLSE